MSGVGKKVVDVAFKAPKVIDWDGMAKMIVSNEALGMCTGDTGFAAYAC